MKKIGVTTIALLAVLLAPPIMASDFVVVGVVGVLEPEGLEPGQALEKDTILRLEPWGRAVLRETTGCKLTQVIAGASEHPLTPTDDCSAFAEPAQVVALVQQGTAFAAPMQEQGAAQVSELVQMLINEPCVFLARVSDEGGNARRCPSGYALRGLRCSGDYCDNKDLLCCPYLEGGPDPSAKELSSRIISEEFPNSFQTKRFLSGLACNGPYCDNILPYAFKSQRLVNTKECEWSQWSSEQPGQWLDCSLGRLTSGLRCREDHCGEVSLYCCGARVE
ncbi:MAG: hypothetical protein OEM62_08530 [Acidobacteriota bacterium]|nr:hypothetical protein [Acidobacteriota bacterium]